MDHSIRLAHPGQPERSKTTQNSARARKARGRSGLPTDKPLAWARMPHDLVELVTDRAYRLHGAIVRRLRRRDDPTDLQLAKDLGTSVATVQRGLRELESVGAITRRRRHGGRAIALPYTLAGRQHASMPNVEAADRVHPLLTARAPIAHDRPAPIAHIEAPPNAPIAHPCAMGAAFPSTERARDGIENGIQTLTLTFARSEGTEPTAKPEAIAKPEATAQPTTTPEQEAELGAELEAELIAEQEAEFAKQEAEWIATAARYPRTHPLAINARLMLAGIANDRARFSRLFGPQAIAPAPGPAPGPAPQPAAIAPAPQPAAALPVETTDLIRRLATDPSPELARATAERIAERLDDPGSVYKFLKDCQEVQSGTLPAKVQIRAFKSAFHSETARNKGAVYTAHIHEHRPHPRGEGRWSDG